MLLLRARKMCERRPQRQGTSAKQPAELTIYNCLYCELIEFITLVCVYDMYFCYIDFLLYIWLYFELAIFSKRFCFPGRSLTCGHPRFHIRCHMPLCAQCFGAAQCARPTKNVRNRADQWNISGTSVEHREDHQSWNAKS